MCEKSPTLNEVIAAEIGSTGPLTFARFMELALYHPQLGYYTSGRAAIGRQGDFYTSVSVGPVFGSVLAGQFREMWNHLGQPAEFHLIEQGAHDGQLACDILDALSGVPVKYTIIEPSAALRDRQLQKLSAHVNCVRWLESPADLPAFDGVVFSNELVDAFPFHLVRSTGTEWEELLVNSSTDGFVLDPAPPCAAVEEDLRDFPVRPAGALAEVRPMVWDWLSVVANKMRRGYVLTIDYGFPRDQLHSSHRKDGTLSCYRDHRRDAQPLQEVGEKDITSHVDFTALARAAGENGFRIEGFTDQHHFFIGATAELLTTLEGPPNATSQRTLRALKTLLHPESMGTQFHYLLLSKGVEEGGGLSGFSHGRKFAKTLFA